MNYRTHPRTGERISTLGLGLGGIQSAPADEIERTVALAIERGINFFDLCGGADCIYAPAGRAIRLHRSEVFVQMHFGAVYNDAGEYGWSRDAERIRQTVDRLLDATGFDYMDYGMLHCIDADEDYEQLKRGGIVDHIRELKKQGVVRHIGLSSHTPEVAMRVLDEVDADLLMFSVNPAYDCGRGDDYGAGTADERAMLYERCARDGIGITVMKPFFAGRLLDAETSPFGMALSRAECIDYALSRPGVLSVLPGARGMADLEALLEADANPESCPPLDTLTAEKNAVVCVYCGHCKPCPAGIDIGLVNKYYDLAKAGDALAASHYDKLSVTAAACTGCGHCDHRCPFGVKQSARMQEIGAYFGK